MTEKRSLSFQRQAVEHIIALCDEAVLADPTVIEAAKQACLTLAWIEKRDDLIKEIIRLDKAMELGYRDRELEIEILKAENERLREALSRALCLIDSPYYRDAAGLRPNTHPAADDIREILALGQKQ